VSVNVALIVREMLKRIGPLRSTVNRARDLLARYRPLVWRLDGHERDSGMPLAVVFAGQLESKNYIAHLVFAEPPRESALGRRWIWRLLPRNQGVESVDLRVIELEPRERGRFRDRYRACIPCWVGGEIDLAAAVAHIRESKNAKEDLRRIRRDQIEYEVTRSQQAFEHFYVHMYLPYIETVYGDRAFSMSHAEMTSMRDRSELFIVKIKGEAVAGLIIVYENGRPRGWSLGVKDGNRAYVRGGALRALDYLLVFYLAGKGHATVHMGASRPFLKDGVLRHKRRIGLRLVDHTSRSYALQPAHGSRAAEAFLKSNPFIGFGKDESLRGMVFLDDESVSSPPQLQRLIAEYEIPGLSGFEFCAAADMKPVVSVATESAVVQANAA
jgi:hypothetical protein